MQKRTFAEYKEISKSVKDGMKAHIERTRIAKGVILPDQVLDLKKLVTLFDELDSIPEIEDDEIKNKITDDINALVMKKGIILWL